MHFSSLPIILVYYVIVFTAHRRIRSWRHQFHSKHLCRERGNVPRTSQ